MSDRELIEIWLDGFQRRRPLRAWRMASPRVVLRLPDGTEYRGRRAAALGIGRIMRHCRGTLRMEPLGVHDLGAGRLVARTHNTARRGAHRLELEMTIEYLVEDGRIARMEERVEDLDAWRAFWRES